MRDGCGQVNPEKSEPAGRFSSKFSARSRRRFDLLRASYATNTHFVQAQKIVAPPPIFLPSTMQKFPGRSTAAILILAFAGSFLLSGCKKKEEDDTTTTYLLAALLFSSSTRAFAGSCNKFSVNSSCTNSYGTFVASSCTGGGGTTSTSKCSNLANYGTCTTTQGASELVYYSGGTSPVCASAGACQTNCTGLLGGTYSAAYTP